MPNFNSLQANYEDIYPNQFLDSISALVIEGNILITGAKGMLGNALAYAMQELQSKGFLNESKIILSSRNWSTKETMYWQKFGNIETVTNIDLLNNYQSIDYVIHTASPSNITKINSIADLRNPNTKLLKNIFRLSPKKILYISSGEVYGGGSTLENQHTNNFSFEVVRDWYPLIKLETEKILHNFGEAHGIQTTVVRLFHTFGPGLKSNDGRSFAEILWRAMEEKRIILKSNGTQTRSFLYISDAVNGILKALFTAQNKQITLNLGSEVPVTIKEFAELVGTHTGANIHINIDDKFEHSPNDFIVPNLDTIKKFNWEPVIDIDTGILRTLRWIEKTKKFNTSLY